MGPVVRASRYYSPGLFMRVAPNAARELGDLGGPEACLEVVVAGSGLVFSPPAGPGVAELAGGGADRGGGQVQDPAGFGDADLDQAGVFGRRVVRAGGEDPGVGPACGLGVITGRDEAGGLCWRAGRRSRGGDGQQREGAQGQHRVAVEGLPQPDLVSVEADLPLGLLVTLFHRPSLPGYSDQQRQGDRPAAGTWQ